MYFFLEISFCMFFILIVCKLNTYKSQTNITVLRYRQINVYFLSKNDFFFTEIAMYFAFIFIKMCSVHFVICVIYVKWILIKNMSVNLLVNWKIFLKQFFSS